jgi:hypothetical protein
MEYTVTLSGRPAVANCRRAVVGLAVTAMALLGYKDNPDEIVQNLRSSIQHTLPMGSDKDHVVAYLQAHAIDKEYFYSDKSRTLYAIIRNVSRSFFGMFRTDIQLQFFFDDQGKLAGYTVEKVVTSF